MAVHRRVHRRVHAQELEARFKPLRPASLPRLVLASLLGPLAWVLAFALVAVLIRFTQIELGFLVTVVSLVIAAIVLVVLRLGRDREERRYVDPT